MSYTVQFQGCTHPPGKEEEAEQLIRSSLEGRLGGPAAVAQHCREVQALLGAKEALSELDARRVEDWQDAVAAASERLDDLWDMRDKPCLDTIGGQVIIAVDDAGKSDSGQRDASEANT